MSLFNEQHFLGEYRILEGYLVDVQTARYSLPTIVLTIPDNGVSARGLVVAFECPNQLTVHTENLDVNISSLRQLVLNRSAGIERIGIVLKQGKRLDDSRQPFIADGSGAGECNLLNILNRDRRYTSPFHSDIHIDRLRLNSRDAQYEQKC